MTAHYVGVNRGDVKYSNSTVVYATSAPSKDLEVLMQDAAGWTRAEVAEALQIIADLIVTGETPDTDKYPAA